MLLLILHIMLVIISILIAVDQEKKRLRNIWIADAIIWALCVVLDVCHLIGGA
jgi:hypothetical protein